MSSRRFPLSACLFLASIIPSATSQLTGCKEVECPHTADGPDYDCKIGNSTLASIGITTIDTEISEEGLTWTMGVQEVKDDSLEKGIYRFDRSVYLGTPPGLDLAEEKSNGGCALFFDGIASDLRFTGPEDDGDAMTCGQVMETDCVDDLLSLAKEKFKDIDNDAKDSTCEALVKAIQEKVPQSCQSAAGSDKWGDISYKGLTGEYFPSPSEEDGCHPTTGEDYNLSFIKNYEIHATASAKDMQPAIDAVTPILTVFYPIDGSDSDSSLKEADASLACLKPVVDPPDNPNETSQKVGGAVSMEKKPILGLLGFFFSIALIL